MSTDQQNFDEEDDACTVCKSKDTWRIKLRGAEAEENKIDEARDEDEESSTKPMLCGHVICIYCLLKYLEIWIEKDKPRIKCPNKYCRKRIHENDIRAVMDLESDDLDSFVSREFRERFLHRHDTITIKYALGEQNTGNCPRCKNIYAKKVGCNHVRCPNLLCNTWFCWECGKEDVTWAHFIASNCHILFDDVLKGLYFLSFLLFAGGCTLAYITPSIVLGLFIFAPLAITFVTPYYILNWVGKQWRRHGAETFSKNQTIVFWSLFVPLYILLLPLGAIIGFLSLFPSSLIFVLFLLMLIVKLIPIVGQIMCIIEMLQCITGCFGYDDWLNWYRRSREEKDMDRVMDRNFRKELSERLANPNVGR